MNFYDMLYFISYDLYVKTEIDLNLPSWTIRSVADVSRRTSLTATIKGPIVKTVLEP